MMECRDCAEQIRFLTLSTAITRKEGARGGEARGSRWGGTATRPFDLRSSPLPLPARSQRPPLQQPPFHQPLSAMEGILSPRMGAAKGLRAADANAAPLRSGKKGLVRPFWGSGCSRKLLRLSRDAQRLSASLRTYTA
jgi:hypothetical protein